MAENKGAEKKAEKKKEEGAGERETVQERNKREKKAHKWTLEVCAKVARRFESREAWAAGHPSSFKAAFARGFEAKCTAHMKSSPVRSTSPKKAAPRKVAPKKKPQSKLPRSA